MAKEINTNLFLLRFVLISERRVFDRAGNAEGSENPMKRVYGDFIFHVETFSLEKKSVFFCFSKLIYTPYSAAALISRMETEVTLLTPISFLIWERYYVSRRSKE